MDAFLYSTNFRVWGSKNATASSLLLSNNFVVPLWKPTELQITLINNHNIDGILFEIADQSPFVSKLSISPEMSAAILKKPNLTAGQLKRATPSSSSRTIFHSSIVANAASAVLVPDWKDKEIISHQRFISVSLIRGTSIVDTFKIEYRIYSKHSGTRSTFLLNPAPGTGAQRASKNDKTEKLVKKPSSSSSSTKAARATTKKTTTPLSIGNNNTVRVKTVSMKASPLPYLPEDTEMGSGAETLSFSFSSPFSFYSIPLPTSPISHDDVLSLADIVHCEDSSVQYSPSPSSSSKTDTESCSDSSSNCADEDFARSVMADGNNINFEADELDNRPLQDSTPFLAQLSV